ncbi:MAG: IS1634 family transposase [Nanoarchaeota archaeon]
MFLRRISNNKNGKSNGYWALVESFRAPEGPRQRTVSYLGELAPSDRAGWAELRRVLNREPDREASLFPDDPPGGDVPTTIEVDIRGVRVERTLSFGDVFIGWRLWQALGLDEFLDARIERGREDVSWSLVAAILALARFCEPSSEMHIADTWYRGTALDDLIGVDAELVNKDRLYRGLDALLPHKEAIETHLRERFVTMFDAEYDLILYDVTSTYFEGAAAGNPQAQRGHSRDNRPDCKQVCIALCVTREGLPIAYDVFPGNRNDVKTLEDIVNGVEKRHGRANRVWVVDRGISSEKNLAFLRARGSKYVVGTPKSGLRRFEAALLESGWSEVQPGVEVKKCAGEGDDETFVLCRSGNRREKEKAIHARFTERIEKGLLKLESRLEKAKRAVERVGVERQIGRLLQRNQRGAGAFNIVVEDDRGRAGGLRVKWVRDEKWAAWAALTEGSYLLRTNMNDWAPEDLWKTYIQLTQAESAFRTQKSELEIRPIWHHGEKRVQAHILISFLAYAMWKTLEMRMSRTGLGNGPRTLLNEVAKIKVSDVILPTTTDRSLRIRCVTDADAAQRALLDRLGIEMPKRLGVPRWTRAKM